MSKRILLTKGIAIIPLTAMVTFGSAVTADAPKNLKELIAGAKKETVLRPACIPKITKINKNPYSGPKGPPGCVAKE